MWRPPECLDWINPLRKRGACYSLRKPNEPDVLTQPGGDHEAGLPGCACKLSVPGGKQSFPAADCHSRGEMNSEASMQRVALGEVSGRLGERQIEVDHLELTPAR